MGLGSVNQRPFVGEALSGADTIVADGGTRDTLGSPDTLLATDGRADDPDPASSGSAPRRLPPDTRVGRYTLVDPLGTGGMGVVYRARDPELDRSVAIKVLRTDREQRDSDRFLREAQAMARLSHPNVVPIYDVGTWGSGLFLAMELIEGETLRKWMQQPHPWREVVAMFVQAGRGLVEAHAAGIVHRDFKPENVLVDRRGRPRVTDFGLARPDASTIPPGTPIGTNHLTRSGTILGTPAYMAPEQLAGRKVDARADVFAFSAALFEALHGHVPFGGRTFAERIEAIELAHVRLPSRRLPRWLLRALFRGLSAKPHARPDMAALLASLERGLHRRRSAWLAAAGLGLAASLGLAVADRGPTCEDSGAALAGLWDSSAQQAVAAALHTSDRPYVADTVARVDELLAAHVAAGADLQRDTCEAHRRGEISSTLLDRRALCLEQRRADLAQTIETLRHADTRTVEKAVDVVRSLRPISTCLDPEAETRDPSALAWAEATRARIAGIRLLEITGKTSEALQQIHEVEAEAAEHADEPLRLEAVYMRARVEQARGDSNRASEAAREAFEGAYARGRDRLASQAAAFLILVDGHARARYELGEAWARVALAGATRVADGGLEEASVRQYYGAMLSSADRNDEALRELEQALTLRTALLGPDDLDTSLTEMSLGNALWKVGRLDEARRHHQAAVRSREATLGREHPTLIAPLANLGVTADALGLRDEARDAWSRSLALILANNGPDHPNAAALHANLASLELAAGDLPAARRHSEASLRVARAAYGPDHPDTALILSNHANLLVKQGEHAAAEAAYREALGALERSVGADHSNHAVAGLALGRLLRQQDRAVEARPLVEAALANTDRTLGASHPRTAEALVELAEILRLTGDTAAAITHLERAVTIVTTAEVTPAERGRTIFALARVLANSTTDHHGDRATRAADLLARATELSEQAGPAGADLRAELLAWKNAHPP